MYSLHHVYTSHLYNPSIPAKHVSRMAMYASDCYTSIKIKSKHGFLMTGQVWLACWKCFAVWLIQALSYFCCFVKATALPAARVTWRERKWDCMRAFMKVRRRGVVSVGQKKIQSMWKWTVSTIAENFLKDAVQGQRKGEVQQEELLNKRLHISNFCKGSHWHLNHISQMFYGTCSRGYQHLSCVLKCAVPRGSYYRHCSDILLEHAGAAQGKELARSFNIHSTRQPPCGELRI